MKIVLPTRARLRRLGTNYSNSGSSSIIAEKKKNKLNTGGKKNTKVQKFIKMTIVLPTRIGFWRYGRISGDRCLVGITEIKKKYIIEHRR